MKKGFTLAELLIVVAIIAVLVAIGIPIFTSQLEKSRESTDLANVRSAYATIMVAANGKDVDAEYNGVAIKSGDKYIITVALEQKQAGWETKKDDLDNLAIGSIMHSDSEHWVGDPADGGGSCIISYTDATNAVLTWSGDSVVTDPTVKLAQKWSNNQVSSEIKSMGSMFYNNTYENDVNKAKYDSLRVKIKELVNADVTYYTVNTDKTNGYYRIRYTEDAFEWDSTYTQTDNHTLTTFTDVYFDYDTGEVIKIMKAKEGAKFQFGKSGSNGDLTGFWTDSKKMDTIYEKTP